MASITLRTIKSKQIIEVSREEYDNLVSSGLIRRYRVIGATCEIGKSDTDKMKDIEAFTKKIAETKPVKSDFAELSKQYRQAKKTDKIKAAELLEQLAVKFPDNKFVKSEITKTNENTTV